MDYTYETKGAQRVAINQLGPALSKRQCTAQVCFRPEPPAPPPPASASDEVKRRYRENLLEQPPPCIIFRGTGKGISQYENRDGCLRLQDRECRTDECRAARLQQGGGGAR